MYEKVETYIYKVGIDNYRIKIQKKDKDTGIELKISQNYKQSLDKVIKIRDSILEEYNDRIKLKKLIPIIENAVEQENSDIKLNLNKKSKITKNEEKLIDTYIYQINKSKYRVRIKKGSKSEIGYFHYSKIIEGTISDARKLRDKKLAEYKLNQSIPSERGNITVEDFCKVFLENHCVSYSPTTYDGTVSKINAHINPNIGKYKIAKLDTFILQKFINGLLVSKNKNDSSKTITSTTANSVYRLLRTILNKAVDWEYIDKNPLLKVQIPPVDKVEKETFNIDELFEVFKAIRKEPIEIQCLFIITMCTGFRRGELIGIHIEDIDFEEGKIYVNRDIVRNKKKHIIVEKKPKTTESVRCVPIPRFCLDVISKYMEWRDRKIEGLKIKNKKYHEIPNLFLGEDGTFMRPEYPSKKWTLFIEKNNFKHVTLHGLRHSYCTLQLNDNTKLGPRDVAKLLGHSQLSTTFHYSHANKEKSAEVVSIFDNFNDGEYFNINSIISICTGRKYTSSSEIQKNLNYLVPNDNIDIKNKMAICKSNITNRYPKLLNVDDSGVSVENVFDWLETQKENFGDSLLLQKISEKDLDDDFLER